MNRSRLAAPLVASLLLLPTSSGGVSRPVELCGPSWRVSTLDVGVGRRGSHVTCVDGDRRCDADGRLDGRCTFAVSACVGEGTRDVLACRASTRVKPLRSLAAALGASLPSPRAGCEPGQSIQAALRGTRQKPRPSRVLRLAMTARIGGKAHRRRLSLRCLPGSAAAPEIPRCPANPRGPDEPNALHLTLASRGSDLDLGWSGAWHGFALPEGAVVRACLAGCDRSTTPQCDATVLTGVGTPNGTTLGPPVPLLAAAVPVCLVNEWAEPTFEGGTADLATGTFAQTVALRSRLFFSDRAHVCPSCIGGVCDFGANAGGPCSVAGAFTGLQPADGPSQDCPPAAENFFGTVPLQLALTTGTSTLAPMEGGSAATPCVAQPGEPPGLPPLADACAGGTCGATCSGDACVDGESPCVDVKGGLSQVCCSNDTTRPCFPTAAGVLERTGSATLPSPAWPGARYPKRSEVTAVATFCMPATELSVVNALAALPGPGAVIAPFSALWLTPAGEGGGPVEPPPGPSPY